MKRTVFGIILMFLCISMLTLMPSSFSQVTAKKGYTAIRQGESTAVSGGISENKTWTLSGSPYIVVGDVFVLVGVFLTIEPGVIVQFAAGRNLTVDGGLIAEGNSTNRITFTSNAITPALSDWGAINIRTGGSYENIEWVVVEYSKNGISGVPHATVFQTDFLKNNLGISGSNIFMNNCTFRSNNIGISASSANVTFCTFYQNGKGGILNSANITSSLFTENALGVSATSANVINSEFYNNTEGIALSQEEAGLSTMDRCRVERNKGVGVQVYSDENQFVNVKNTNVTNNKGDGIAGSAYYSLSIQNCMILNNQGWGVSAPASVYGSTISNNSEGFHLFGIVSHTSVSQNVGVGVSGSGSVEYSDIWGNSLGIEISEEYWWGGGIDKVSHCRIFNNSKGGIVAPPSVTGGVYLNLVEDSVIENNGRFGIRMNTTQGTSEVFQSIGKIVNCLISNQSIGVLGSFHPTIGLVEYSTIKGSQIGLDIYDQAAPILWNNIYGNALYNIRDNLPFGSDINATHNWWGTINETTIKQLIYDYYDNYNLSRVLYKPYLTTQNPEHYYDLALTSIQLTRIIVGQGSSTNINVTAANQGNFAETFAVTVYANTTIINQTAVTLASGNTETLTFRWHTSGFAKGNYTISAYAWPVPGETNTADNTCTGGVVKITILGDVNGDKMVNVLDLILIVLHLGHTNGDGHTPYSPDWYKCVNTDLNNDGKHNVLDLILCALHLGQHW